jgi:hypothetical protein
LVDNPFEKEMAWYTIMILFPYIAMLTNSFHKWLACKKKRLPSTLSRYEEKRLEDPENLSWDLVTVHETKYSGKQHYYGHHINQLPCNKAKIVSDSIYKLNAHD